MSSSSLVVVYTCFILQTSSSFLQQNRFFSLSGDVQRDNIAIADLEVKSAELEAYRANLHRRKAEVKSQLREEVLALVLEYEAAEREYVLAQSKLATYSQRRQLVEIDYQFGNGSTTQMLSMWQQGESLEAKVIQIESKTAEIARKIQQLIA